MNQAALTEFMERIWEDEILPALSDYIRIPNKSPAFDPKWALHGHMDRAVSLFEGWARARIAKLPGAKLDVVRLEGRTPLIFFDIPATKAEAQDTVLLYGHLDKQPEMVGWAEGTGPWVPVVKDDKLYGRGGGDDGYAMFASLAALLALAEQNIAHARCVILIEACEESGSYDLPAYIDHLADRIGTPSLVVCLDSGCGDYERLWLTTSLRGIAMGTLTVRVLTEGVHSGDASGIVPSSFRILRQCLSRIEDETTGEIKLSDLFVQVPPDRLEQAKQSAKILGDAIYSKMPFASGTKPMSDDLTQLVLNRTWRPQLAVTGMEGYPVPENAGNVLLPFSTAKLSLRLPPTCDGETATQSVKRALEADAPYHAEVVFLSLIHIFRPPATGKRRPKASSARLKPMRPITPKWCSMPKAARPDGIRPRSSPGSRKRWRAHPKAVSENRQPIWARAAAFPSWRCWAKNFPKLNSW